MVAKEIALTKLPDRILEAVGNRIVAAIEDGITPSATLAVFHYDTPILNAAWGNLTADDSSPDATTKTLYDLGTLTRIYTTLALLSQISDDKVGLHTPVVSVLPDFGASGKRPIAGGQDPSTGQTLPVIERFNGEMIDPKTINCFQLLTHTSGLPAWRDLYRTITPPPPPTELTMQAHIDRWQALSETIYHYPFETIPEMTVVVSDIAYILMGTLVATIDGSSSTLADVIRQRVLGDRFSRTLFQPMTQGFTLDEIAPTYSHNRWRDRALHGEVLDDNASALGGITGYAGLFGTAFEVGLLGNVWLNHAQRLLKIDPELAGAATELQAQTGSSRFGLGWELQATSTALQDDLGSNSYGQQSDHGTSLWIDPQEKLVIAFLTNQSYTDSDDIAYLMLRRDIHNLIIDFARR